MQDPDLQNKLSTDQIGAFYHDVFVEDQTQHFITLTDLSVDERKLVVDIGGGCGFFAQRLFELTHHSVRVFDMDAASIEACRKIGVDAELGDALAPAIHGDEEIICFNLILHHLIGRTEKITLDLQRKAIMVWRNQARSVFINEYIYESYLPNFSGWLIFQITKSRLLSWFGRKLSMVVPSFKANTFGVGVRFRSHNEWTRIFESSGYVVKDRVIGREERVSAPLRLLLIKNIRRDSFLLQPASNFKTATVDL